MFSYLWIHYLYQPLFNALILIYNGIAHKNMGWAVVWLTIFLRIVLLPLNILSERNSIRHELADEEARAVAKSFKSDAITAKAETRKVMRKYKISPWAKVLMLSIQVLVLVLLYQVFIHGISGERMAKTLYTNIQIPGDINTVFYGADIGERHNVLWAILAAVYFFGSLIIEHKNDPHPERPDLLYIIGFPIFMFLVLWYLPMVKSLFVLTTMLFSDSITLIRKAFFPAKKAAHEPHH